MGVGQFRHLTPARRALDKSFFYKEGLIDLLHSAGILPHCCSNGADAHGSALKLVDDGRQYLVVNLVQAVAVDVERLQGHTGYADVDGAVALHLSKVAHTAQQSVGDTRRAATAAGNLSGCFLIDGEAQDGGRTDDDALQRLAVVVLQMQVDAEARSQRCRQKAAARSGAYQRERRQVYLNAARRRTFVKHDVYPVVLHRRIKILLHHR